VLGVARRRGWRVNLRPLAEVQTLAWVIGLVLLVRWLVALCSSEGGLFSLDEAYFREQEAWREAQAAAQQAAAQQQQQQQQHFMHDQQHVEWGADML
jgi:hypothetical protein